MKASKVIWAVVACTAVLSAVPSEAEDLVDGFAPRTFVGSDGTRMPYRLFVPPVEVRVGPLPAIVYLHGSPARGDDNLAQISAGNLPGARSWAAPAAQARHPAFVIAPQLPIDERWARPGTDGLSRYAALVVELVENLSREFGIDRDRVYLTGQSLGGSGTWDLIVERPDFFAAAVPLCGEGTPSRAAAIRNLPIWVFHGAKDIVIPVARSREMVAALRAVGSGVKYTEYRDVGHDVWERAYTEPALAEWLFAQKRPSPATKPPVP